MPLTMTRGKHLDWDPDHELTFDRYWFYVVKSDIDSWCYRLLVRFVVFGFWSGFGHGF